MEDDDADIGIAAPNKCAKRAAILSTARYLWAHYGYHRISLRRIASDADVTLSLIHRYFESKHSLFQEACVLFAVACEAAYREFPRQTSKQLSEAIDDMATRLVRPIEILMLQGQQGQDALRLWLRHWDDELPELKLPLERALLPLKNAVVDALAHLVPPGQRHGLLTPCCIAFAAGVSAISWAGPHSSAGAGWVDHEDIRHAVRNASLYVGSVIQGGMTTQGALASGKNE